MLKNTFNNIQHTIVSQFSHYFNTLISQNCMTNPIPESNINIGYYLNHIYTIMNFEADWVLITSYPFYFSQNVLK